MPSPPPGLPTLTQRAKAIQLAARQHTGFIPKGSSSGRSTKVRQVCQMFLPLELSICSAEIPNWIVITAASGIQYECDDGDVDENIENISMSSHGDVFRRDDEYEPIEQTGKHQATDTVPRTCMEGAIVVAVSEADYSGDDTFNEEHPNEKSSLRCFLRGFMAAISNYSSQATKFKLD
jgi:hypothetical protein